MIDANTVLADQEAIASLLNVGEPGFINIRPLDADKLDSFRKPRSLYYDKIEKMDDADVLKQVHNTFIQCHLGGDADARWKVDALEWECTRRGRPDIYDQGYDTASKVDLTKRV